MHLFSSHKFVDVNVNHFQILSTTFILGSPFLPYVLHPVHQLMKVLLDQKKKDAHTGRKTNIKLSRNLKDTNR